MVERINSTKVSGPICYKGGATPPIDYHEENQERSLYKSTLSNLEGMPMVPMLHVLGYHWVIANGNTTKDSSQAAFSNENGLTLTNGFDGGTEPTLQVSSSTPGFTLVSGDATENATVCLSGKPVGQFTDSTDTWWYYLFGIPFGADSCHVALAMGTVNQPSFAIFDNSGTGALQADQEGLYLKLERADPVTTVSYLLQKSPAWTIVTGTWTLKTPIACSFVNNESNTFEISGHSHGHEGMDVTINGEEFHLDYPDGLFDTNPIANESGMVEGATMGITAEATGGVLAATLKMHTAMVVHGPRS